MHVCVYAFAETQECVKNNLSLNMLRYLCRTEDYMKRNSLFGRLSVVIFIMALTVCVLCEPAISVAKSKSFIRGFKPTKNELLWCSVAPFFEWSDGSYPLIASYSVNVNQGKNFYVGLNLPHPKVKKVTFKSSNNKVLKIVNKKQGKVKAVKTGTAKLTLNVVWVYTGKTGACHVADTKKDTYHKKTLKKGKTYTTQYTYKIKVICKEKGHKYSAWKMVKKSTCAKEGIRQRKCKKCGYTDTSYVKRLNHKYGDWSISKKPTCKMEGEKIRICSLCKKKQKQYIDVSEHDYDSNTHVCTMCGEEDPDYDFDEDYEDETY